MRQQCDVVPCEVVPSGAGHCPSRAPGLDSHCVVGSGYGYWWGVMVDVLLGCAGVLAIGVAALSGRLRTLPLSEPVLGLLAGVLLGPVVLGVLRVPSPVEEPGWLHEATRILLAISVMSVALRYPIRDVRSRPRPVLLLLAVVLPVMAALPAGGAGAALGAWLGSAALLGAALCPTDPVLASNVVTGTSAERDLPARDRQLLSLESR